MSRPLRRTGGVFRDLHQAVVPISIDFGRLDLSGHAPALLEEARRTWKERVQTELRSLQIMTRFLSDSLAAGDPLEVYAGAVDLVRDELAHVTLCAELVRAMGADTELPEPLEVKQPDDFSNMPPQGRALATAIGMLCVNETLSVAFIEDLAARCETPVIADVLAATLADESSHDAYGWEYVRASLARFPEDTRPAWRRVAAEALEPHRRMAGRILSEIPAEKRTLEAWDEPERAALGLFGPQRQALVFERCLEGVLAPRLREVGLLGEG
jgi:hypothetical protein